MKPSTCHHLIFVEKVAYTDEYAKHQFLILFFSNETDGYMKDVMNDADSHKLRTGSTQLFRASVLESK